MYSAVGSYIGRAWRIFDFRFTRYPPSVSTWLLALLIYLNFFTHHFMADLRWPLVLASVLLFGRSWVLFTPGRRTYAMPLVVGFMLVALFVWLAENLATYGNIWLYPAQTEVWTPVSPQKIVAWYLLMMVSFVLVSLAQKPVLVTNGSRYQGVFYRRLRQVAVRSAVGR